MAKHTEFVEAEGVVHMVNPIQAEFTLCGDAFDLASDVEDYAWTATKRREVTCTLCGIVVEACRGVRVS